VIDELLSALGTVGYALDTPGAYTRGLLAGRPGERVDGRDMLESLGYYHAATQPPQLTQGVYEAEPYSWEQRR
jgi:hypothetical protein